MASSGSNPRAEHAPDPMLRAVNRATSAAAAVLDPDVIPGNAADALVRFLGARRADLWRFDGRRAVHLAAAGRGAESPQGLPAALVRVARGGLSQTLTSDELGHGVGTEWRRLLFSIDAHAVSIHALTVGEQVLGAITVVADNSGPDVPDEVWTIFAQQVAASMQQAQLHRAAKDAALRMRVQNRVLAELTEQRDVLSLRNAVEHLVVEMLGDAAVAVLPIDSLGRVTVPVSSPACDATLRVATSPEVTFVAPALESAGPVRFESLSLRMCASLGLSSLAALERLDKCTVWAIQLHAGDRASGVLLFGTQQTLVKGTEADDRARELLVAMAPAVAIALENAQLFAREHVRASRLAAANSLARTVTSCATRDDLYTAIAIGIGALFGYARSAVYDGDLRTLAEQGRAMVRSTDRERSLVSTALHRRRPSRVERHDRTCHALPLVTGERIHAVLYAEQPDTVTPEQESDDLALLASMCEHASACLLAIEATENIERNYKDTIQALVHALEARDEYTADHSDAVAAWALDTGRRLGMSDDDLRDLELGAILHDIGKVAVPDAILNKPGRLTDEEFEVMKSHTIVGERILKPIGFLKNVAPIVRHEHERWDGLGYPDGVSGEQIPLASRIIFVCDAYHAITSDRPYRTGQTHAFARRILTDNAGTQFDPAVVSVFLDVIDSWCLEHGIESGGDPLEGVEIVNPLGAVAQKSATAGEDAAAA